MGLLNQIIRSLKESFKNLRKKFSRRESKKSRKNKPVVLHPSWSKSEKPGKSDQKSQVIIQRNKKRLPGLLVFKRLLAGFLFLINFVLSQFLLASAGEQGFGTFLIFLGNAFILADYLWKTRRQKD